MTTGSSMALSRLSEERKVFRKSRTFGFAGKPKSAADGATNLMEWECIVPGKEGTIWEGGRYPVTLEFPAAFPSKAPTAKFPPGFLHPNVYPEGHVCLSILNDDPEMGGCWAASLTVQQILSGIQDLLENPNVKSPAQDLAYNLMRLEPEKYRAKVRRQALKYTPPDE